MTQATIDLSLMTRQEPRYRNINEASKACGLSPSVLRIWELRYGWPNPKRQANGYRAYSPHLLTELKRMAELVDSGVPIRQCIENGMPKWPADGERKHIRTVKQTRALPVPIDSETAALQGRLIDAIERHQVGQLREHLERLRWSARPDDELLAAHVPAVMGLAELRRIGRPLGDSESGIMHWLIKRTTQLQRRYRCDGDHIHVCPAGTDDAALACVIALILRRNGHNAIAHLQDERPRGRVLLADLNGDADEDHEQRIVALEDTDDDSSDSVTLMQLLQDPERVMR